MSFKHDDFCYTLKKYRIKTEEDEDYHPPPTLNTNPNNNNGQQREEVNDEIIWNHQNQVGGSEWYKQQQMKQDRGDCLFLPNKNSSYGKGMKSQRGFRIKEILKCKELLYLKKTTLFLLWRIQNHLMNVFTLQIFLVSLEANNMDMLFFHNGLLSSADLKIEVRDSNQKKRIMDVIHKTG